VWTGGLDTERARAAGPLCRCLRSR
jgi:hypothetical protein